MKTLPKAETVVKQAEEAFKETHGPMLGKTTILKTVVRMVKNGFVSGYLLGYVKGFELNQEEKDK